MAERDRPPAYAPSAEGAAMARAERARWLSVAEGQALRENWEQTKAQVDTMAAKFDENPEDGIEAGVFIGLSLMATLSFTDRAGQAARRVRPLMGEMKPDAG